MTKPLNFILLGRSGSGKGTQAELLIKHFKNLVYFSTGDLLRDLTTKDSQGAKKTKMIIESGGLPPEVVATALWIREILYKVKEDEGIVLDGSPRRVEEAEHLDQLFSFLDRLDSTKFLLIDISRQEAFNRLSKRRICKNCGFLVPYVGEYKNWENCKKCDGKLVLRPDDKPEAINSRLDFFDQSVVKVIEYYQKKNVLIIINGEQPIEKVFEEILRKI